MPANTVGEISSKSLRKSTCTSFLTYFSISILKIATRKTRSDVSVKIGNASLKLIDCRTQMKRAFEILMANDIFPSKALNYSCSNGHFKLCEREVALESSYKVIIFDWWNWIDGDELVSFVNLLILREISIKNENFPLYQSNCNLMRWIKLFFIGNFRVWFEWKKLGKWQWNFSLKYFDWS